MICLIDILNIRNIFHCASLDDYDKINLTSVNKLLFQYRSKIIFSKPYKFKYVSRLKYVNNFTDIIVSKSTDLSLLTNIRTLRFSKKINSIIDFKLPPNIDTIIFGRLFNQLIISTIPDHVTTIIFDDNFNLPLISHVITILYNNYFNLIPSSNIFPPSLTKIKFGYHFNQKIPLIKSLKSIEFGYCFNQSIIGCLPYGLEELIFGSRFNKSISRKRMPDTVKPIIFGDDFDRVVDGNLPDGLIKLVFGSTYNHPITSSTIPPNVQYIKFGDRFNQPINIKFLPSNLSELHFTKDFNQPLIIPASVKKVTFSDAFDKTIEFEKDSLIEKIKFGYHFNQLLSKVWPSTIKYLKFNGKFNKKLHLPRNLTKLYLFGEFNQKINKPFPNSLEEIYFGREFNKIIKPNIFGEHLKVLHFGTIYDKPLISGSLPNSLTELKFGSCFNQKIDENVLPINLRELHFGINFNQSIIGIIPSSVTKLCLGQNFDQKLDLPFGIKDLTILNPLKNNPVHPGDIPSSMTKLKICSIKLTESTIPSSVTEMYITVPFLHPTFQIPSTVTKLEFSVYINNQTILELLTPSIKYLTMHNHINPDLLPKTIDKITCDYFGKKKHIKRYK